MPAGRPTKRTPETEKRILDALRIGATRKDAGLAAGISKETFCQWMNEFPDFSDSVEKAESEDKIRMLAVITKASQEGNWQAAAWRLERKDPDNFGRRERRQVEVSGPNGGPIRHEDAALTDEERAERIVAILDSARARRDRQAAE